MKLGKGGIVEEVIPLSDVDPVTCKEKLKGDVDERGLCLVRVRYDSNKPEVAELLQLKYMGRGRPTPPPQSTE